MSFLIKCFLIIICEITNDPIPINSGMYPLVGMVKNPYNNSPKANNADMIAAVRYKPNLFSNFIVCSLIIVICSLIYLLVLCIVVGGC